MSCYYNRRCVKSSHFLQSVSLLFKNTGVIETEIRIENYVLHIYQNTNIFVHHVRLYTEPQTDQTVVQRVCVCAGGIKRTDWGQPCDSGRSPAAGHCGATTEITGKLLSPHSCNRAAVIRRRLPTLQFTSTALPPTIYCCSHTSTLNSRGLCRVRVLTVYILLNFFFSFFSNFVFFPLLKLIFQQSADNE